MTEGLPTSPDQIVLRGFESRDLDYKAPMKWEEGNKQACCALVKDVLAMANSLGGVLVIGVEEAAGRFVPTGLSDEQLESFETSRLNRFVQKYSDPPVNTTLRKVESDGKHFVIISIPRFDSLPHLCKQEYPGVLAAATLYVRTANNESAPLRSPSDFHELIERALRNRADTLLESVEAILHGPRQHGEANQTSYEQQLREADGSFEERLPEALRAYQGYRQAVFYPSDFDAKRFAPEQLTAALDQASVSYRGWPFIFLSGDANERWNVEDGVESLVVRDWLGADRIDYWRFRQSGFFCQRVLMVEEGNREAPLMDFLHCALYVAEALDGLARLYRGLLSDAEDVTCRIRVLGTQGRRLVRTDGLGADLSGGYISGVPVIEHTRTLPLAEWRSGLIDHALEACREIYRLFNWDTPNLVTPRQHIEQMFARRL